MMRGCKPPHNDPHDAIIRGVRVNLASLLGHSSNIVVVDVRKPCVRVARGTSPSARYVSKGIQTTQKQVSERADTNGRHRA